MKEKIFELLRVHPHFSNKLIAEHLGMQEASVKTTLHRAKVKGEITVTTDEDGQRLVLVPDEILKPREWKNETYLNCIATLEELNATGQLTPEEVWRNVREIVRITQLIK